MNYFIPFMSAMLGGGIIGFIQFLIQRNDDKNDRLASVEKRLGMIEKDQCRTQMLLLISDYPTENAEIMKVAEYYFKPEQGGGLGGDWYMTNLFNRWLTAQKLGKPEWFNEKG